MNRRYKTIAQVIDFEILPALNTFAELYNVDKIAELTYTYKVDRDNNGNELLDTAGYEPCVSNEKFWEIVLDNHI